MAIVGARGWWGSGIVVAVVLAGAGLWWARARHASGPLARGRAAYGRGDWSQAAALAYQRLDAAPNDPHALRLLARSFARQGLDDLAQGVYRRIPPERMAAEDFFLLGAGLVRQGKYDRAQAMLEKARAINPEDPESLDALAQLDGQGDRFEEAAGLARQLAAIPGWEVRGQLLLGMLRNEQNDPAGAAAALAAALRRDSKAPGGPTVPAGARKLLARVLLQTGRPAEARAELHPVLAAGLDPEASWLLSRAFLQEGAVARAVAALGQARGYRPDDPQAPEPAPYVGSARCAACHPAIYRAEQTSRHAQTLARPAGLRDLPLPARAVPDRANPGVTHTLHRVGGRIRVETRVGDQVLGALADYGIGSGEHGLTLVGHDDQGQSRELRLSHYAEGSRWDLTTGHPLHPRDPHDFVGRALTPDGLRLCLSCHTTNARSARDRTGPEAADRGIGCERCHGPGGHHLQAVAADFPDPAIGRPRLASAAQVTRLCDQCHSSLADPVGPANPEAARFKVSTLVQSRCYTESAGRLSCVTCHNPHRNAQTGTAFYEAKCLACHAPSPRASRTSCPVNPTSHCLDCHMPVVKDAMPHTSFTDHHIRVHRAAAGER